MVTFGSPSFGSAILKGLCVVQVGMAAVPCCISEGSSAGWWSQPMAEHTAWVAGQRRGALCKYREMGMASLASFVMQRESGETSERIHVQVQVTSARSGGGV